MLGSFGCLVLSRVGCLTGRLAVKQSVDGGLLGYGNEMMVKFSGYDGAVRG